MKWQINLFEHLVILHSGLKHFFVNLKEFKDKIKTLNIHCQCDYTRQQSAVWSIDHTGNRE